MKILKRRIARQAGRKLFILMIGVVLGLTLGLATGVAKLNPSSSQSANSSADPHPQHLAAGTTQPISLSSLPKGFAGHDRPMLVEDTHGLPKSSDIGAFRTVCLWSHFNYDDPLVFPGQPGRSHLHLFFGNSLTDAFSTADSLRNSGNSTCRGGTVNRSAYWVPALLNSEGKPLTPFFSNFYYKSGYRGVRGEDVKPLPAGLRMIAGKVDSQGPQPYVVAWSGDRGNCTDRNDAIPLCSQGSEVTMTIRFPQCWDGKNLDSPNHQSHMAYAEGGCPASHPVALPEIAFNVHYQVEDPNGTGKWRLSSDRYDAALPGGYSAHGDWFNGWDTEMVETWTRNCHNQRRDCGSETGDGKFELVGADL